MKNRQPFLFLIVTIFTCLQSFAQNIDLDNQNEKFENNW